MTIYIEAVLPYARVTCLDPLFLGYIRPVSFPLGRICEAVIKDPYPGGYSMIVGKTKGYMSTCETYTQGQGLSCWVSREPILSQNMDKPLRLQPYPLQCPLHLYDWQAFIKKHPHHSIEVKDSHLWPYLKTLSLENPLKLNQTMPCPPEVQEAWDQVFSPLIPWNKGHLIVEEGLTLTAIDVNTAAYEDGGSAVLTSLASIKAYWHQVIPVVLQILQVRTISGMILVDLPRLPYKMGMALLNTFEKDLNPLELKSLGLTRGGLWEITRTRRVPSLLQQRGAL
jgi:hypothetical protein